MQVNFQANITTGKTNYINCIWIQLDHLKASQGKKDGIWSALGKDLQGNST